eukprot:TRINITY_DN36502_c0_g1_i2.p1 TRINITY_DN36502_c0_g1~~TRINITY_DN36502_c0_g1_i2.p1  ORF type:complete len:193 (-),score=28.88 TRINITY_DN36502_c0_g1_i2:23-601(-)
MPQIETVRAKVSNSSGFSDQMPQIETVRAKVSNSSGFSDQMPQIETVHAKVLGSRPMQPSMSLASVTVSPSVSLASVPAAQGASPIPAQRRAVQAATPIRATTQAGPLVPNRVAIFSPRSHLGGSACCGSSSVIRSPCVSARTAVSCASPPIYHRVAPHSPWPFAATTAPQLVSASPLVRHAAASASTPVLR